MAVVGAAAFVLGAACMAGAQVAVKARRTQLDPMALATWQMLVAGLVLSAVGVAVEGNPLAVRWSGSALAALAYLSVIGSALGFFLFYWMLGHMQVTKALSVMLTHPPLALVLGWLVLGETLGWRVLVGAVAIIAGLRLILSPSRTRLVAKPRLPSHGLRRPVWVARGL